jgi:hypothetical protein
MYFLRMPDAGTFLIYQISFSHLTSAKGGQVPYIARWPMSTAGVENDVGWFGIGTLTQS